MSLIKQYDPDFYHEYIYENKDKNHDMAKTRSRFKPEEITALKKDHDYWENARLKAWGQKYRESKKEDPDTFEYLL